MLFCSTPFACSNPPVPSSSSGEDDDVAAIAQGCSSPHDHISILGSGSSDLHLDYRQRRSFFYEHHNFIDLWLENIDLVHCFLAGDTAAGVPVARWRRRPANLCSSRSHAATATLRSESQSRRSFSSPEKLNQPDLSCCQRYAFIPVISSPEKLNRRSNSEDFLGLGCFCVG
ncbi:hypothetical protein Droror1_Dr00024880 [Drosera rotundifolia]